MTTHLDKFLADRAGGGARATSPCCYRAATDLGAGYCDGCGKPLLRCAAFEECAGLLDDHGACQVCVSPELSLDAGSVRDAKVGGELTFPLIVQNRSRVGRPLFVKGLWTREGGGDWQPLEMSWDRLDAGASAPLLVRATALDRAGEHRLEILIAFASRWRWREEVLAYTAGLAITVEGEDAVTVQQNIHYSGDAPQTGATIYAPFKIEGGVGRGARAAGNAAAGPQILPLTRATLVERRLGLRGDVGGAAVPRGVTLCWRGFPADRAPGKGPIVTRDGLLHLGRARTSLTGGPNEVRLLAMSEAGDVDEEASRAISRQHFALYVENDRLMLHVQSERGAFVNDRRVARGEAVHLKDGDRFSPIPRDTGPLSVAICFEEHHGVVESITMTQHPSAGRGDRS